MMQGSGSGMVGAAQRQSATMKRAALWPRGEKAITHLASLARRGRGPLSDGAREKVRATLANLIAMRDSYGHDTCAHVTQSIGLLESALAEGGER